MNSRVRLLALAAALAVPAMATAAGTLSMSIGLDYSSGEYGGEDSTDTWVVPLIGKYESAGTPICANVAMAGPVFGCTEGTTAINAGIPEAVRNLTLRFRYNDIASVDAFLEEMQDRSADKGGPLVVKLPRAPGAREQRTREEDRRADAPAQLGIERRVADVRGAECQSAIRLLADRHADVIEDRQHRVNVQDVRDILEDDLLIGEECCGENRQGGVLVTRGGNAAGQRVRALDHELLAHGRAR